MNAKDFFQLVARMREAQKTYFSTRSPGSLTLSKRLEKDVDEEIRRVNQVLDRQQSLFP